MHKIEANEIVGTTFYTIKRIGEHKKGGDALLLYFGYIEQSRIQQTNQTRSTDIFMMKKLSRGRDRINSAKKVLKELGLIDIIQVRDNKGIIQTCYVKVNFLINEEKVRNNNIQYETQLAPPQSCFPVSGKTTTNALSTKTKCFKYNNINIHENNFALLSSFGLSKANIEKWFLYKKTLEDIIDDCNYIRKISFDLNIFPIYNKQTINATDILRKKGYLDDYDCFLDKVKNDWICYEVDDYLELIRQDYYLPKEIANMSGF